MAVDPVAVTRSNLDLTAGTGPGRAELGLLREAAQAVAQAVRGLSEEERHRMGDRPGQYYLDLVAEAAAAPVLMSRGWSVLSEESGYLQPADGSGRAAGTPLYPLVVIDPVDGSTNASRCLPGFSTSLCLLDETGPLAALVLDLYSGDRYEALRGEGATLNDSLIPRPRARTAGESVVAVSGLPARHGGWWQFRALGCASLEMCAVAAGRLDAYVVLSPDGLAPWDYLGALLVCEEVGIWAADQLDRGLLSRDPSQERRSPVVATTRELAESVLSSLSG